MATLALVKIEAWEYFWSSEVCLKSVVVYVCVCGGGSGITMMNYQIIIHGPGIIPYISTQNWIELS